MASCQIVEAANQLKYQVKLTSQIPADFDPSDLSYNEILAVIRHEHINYEELLNELPLCVDIWNAGGCDWGDESECPLAKEAHDIIKWQAKEVAEQAWRERI